MLRPRTLAVSAFACLVVAACSEDEATSSPASESSSSTGGSAEASAPNLTVPTFTDVTAQSGITFRHVFLDSETGSNYQINPYDHGSGVNVADVDGDGLEDLYFLNFLGPNALYRNKGGFQFEDITEKAGVAVPRALSVGAAFGDFDNDGDQDLYVTTYRGGNLLYQNKGDGTFEDVTEKGGVGYVGHSNAATWFDYDLDGDLDLYLCNIGKFTTETISQEANYFYAGVSLPFADLANAPEQRNPGEADKLYRNNGDGTFEDVAASVGIDSGEWNGDAAVADIDLDGDADLYVSNMFGANHLFRNDGGRFTEVTDASLVRTSWGGMGARFFDGNGDAYPDLYVVDMHSDMWMTSNTDPGVVKDASAKYNTPLGYEVKGGKAIAKADDTITTDTLFGNTYFENKGDGTFEELSASAGLEMWWPWGVASGDFNNDGSEDMFVAAGMGYPFFYWPNHLYLNDGSGSFSEVAQAAGIEPPAQGEVLAGAEINGREFTRSSRCAAAADLDGDGDLDLIVNNFNHEPYVLRNDSPAGNALQLELVGKSSNRDAVGARVVVHAGGKTYSRQTANAQGYLTQSTSILHVGLGDATKVDKVEVFWPGSTEAQVLEAPALGQVVRVTQE